MSTAARSKQKNPANKKKLALDKPTPAPRPAKKIKEEAQIEEEMTEPKSKSKFVKQELHPIYNLGYVTKSKGKNRKTPFFKADNPLVPQLTEEQKLTIMNYVGNIKEAVNDKDYQLFDHPFPKKKSLTQEDIMKQLYTLIDNKFVDSDTQQYKPMAVLGIKPDEDVPAGAAEVEKDEPLVAYAKTQDEAVREIILRYKKAKTVEELEQAHAQSLIGRNPKGVETLTKLYKEELKRINPNSPQLNPILDASLQPRVDKASVDADLKSTKPYNNPEMDVSKKDIDNLVQQQGTENVILGEQRNDMLFSADVGNMNVIPQAQPLLEQSKPNDELNMNKNTMSTTPENEDIVVQPLEQTTEPKAPPSKTNGQVENLPAMSMNPQYKPTRKPIASSFFEQLESEEAKVNKAFTQDEPPRTSKKRLQSQQVGPTITGMSPPQREAIGQTEALTPAQVAIMRATEQHIKQAELTQAAADREYDKTIGVRERTGLSMNDAVPKADILVKDKTEKAKSLARYANMSWVETSFGDSKMGRKSSLQKMQDEEDKMRYAFAWVNTPKHPKSQRREYVDNHDYIYRNYDNEMTSMYGSRDETAMHPIYERQNNMYGMRPQGARPYTITDMGDWTYCHRGVVGTQNLGMTPMYNPSRRRDFHNDTTYYPDVMMNTNRGSLEDDFKLKFR